MDADGERDEGMPLWVKASGLVALAVVLVVVILHLTGNSPGGHGP